MIVTTEWMTDKFGMFNAEYFEGSLPLPEMRVSRSKTRLGTMSYKYGRRLFRLTKKDYVIRMTSAFDMSERQAEDILLHEMIHLYIASQGIKDSSAHGRVFRSMMNRLNNDYGREIKISVSMKDYAAAEHRGKARTRLVLLLRHSEAGYIVTVVNVKYRDRLERIICRVKEITEHKWRLSNDEYFASFPQVRTLRGRRVNRQEYERIESMLDTSADGELDSCQ